MTYRQGKRRVMTKFRLNEVSFVDRPAQPDALADIAKAHVDDLLDDDFDKRMKPNDGETRSQFVRRFMESDEASDKSAADRQKLAGETFENALTRKRGDLVSLLTSSNEGHQHGVSVHGSGDGLHLMVHFAAAEGGHNHDHQLVRQDDGTYAVSENQGHTHTIDTAQVASALLDVMNKAFENPEWDDVPLELGGMALADLPEVAKASETPMDQGDDTMSAEELKKAQEERDAALAKAEELGKIAALSGVHKAHYDGIDKDLDADAAKAFLAMDEAARDAEVAKAEAAKTDADPVVYKAMNGDEFRKSDDPRLVKAVKAADEDRKALVLEKARNDDADLTKRAEELDALPGDVKVRKAILKAVDGIEDEELRKSAHDALNAKNDAMKGITTSVGTSASPSIEKSGSAKEAEAELDKQAKDLAKKDGIDYYDAYEKVAAADPELVSKALGA